MRSLLDDNNIENLISNAKNYKNYKLILNTVENLSQKDLQNISVKILKKSNDLITLFINNTDNGVMVMGMLGKNASKKSDLHMGNIVKEIVTGNKAIPLNILNIVFFLFIFSPYANLPLLSQTKILTKPILALWEYPSS